MDRFVVTFKVCGNKICSYRKSYIEADDFHEAIVGIKRIVEMEILKKFGDRLVVDNRGEELVLIDQDGNEVLTVSDFTAESDCD